MKLQNLTKSFSTKLKLLEEVLGLIPPEMAEIGGCSQASYYRYRSGKSIPGWDFLFRIIDYDKRINSDWLLKDAGSILNVDKSEYTFKDGSIKLPFFHMYEDNITGEGSLSIADWRSSIEEISICVDILNMTTIESIDHLIVVKAQCDSMYPDIKPGSIVIVDKLQNNINLDSIYLIKMADAIRMKHIQRAPNNKVQLSSYNDKYKPMFISLDEIVDSIIGKIVWVGTPYN